MAIKEQMRTRLMDGEEIVEKVYVVEIGEESWTFMQEYQAVSHEKNVKMMRMIGTIKKINSSDFSFLGNNDELLFIETEEQLDAFNTFMTQASRDEPELPTKDCLNRWIKFSYQYDEYEDYYGCWYTYFTEDEVDNFYKLFKGL